MGSVVQVHPGSGNCSQWAGQGGYCGICRRAARTTLPGEVIKHIRYQLYQHLLQGHTADDKSITTRIDQNVKVKQQRLATPTAQIKDQEAQRVQGILRPDSHPNAPPRTGTALYGLRPSPALPATTPG